MPDEQTIHLSLSSVAVLFSVFGGLWVMIKIGDRLWRRGNQKPCLFTQEDHAEIRTALTELSKSITTLVNVTKTNVEVQGERHKFMMAMLSRIDREADN